MSSAVLPRPHTRATTIHRKYAPLYRFFHDYFITHIPSSSLHPDSRASQGPGHQLPRSASKPHDSGSGPSPAPLIAPHHTRDTTVVRIPIRNAKHHFGASCSRGTRPYNEDAFQAGVLNIPAFAKKGPQSVSRAPAGSVLDRFREQQRLERERVAQEGKKDGTDSGASLDGADTPSGDPQVFYFGIFDGHGGAKCSGYLAHELHTGIEETARLYDLPSTIHPPSSDTDLPTSETTTQNASPLLTTYKREIGGYFRRFSPPLLSPHTSSQSDAPPQPPPPPSILTILTHAFLSLDLAFLQKQQGLLVPPTTSSSDDRPINDLDSSFSSPNSPHHLTRPHSPHTPPSLQPPPKPFLGGSTASIALISTPTPTPFWHPSTTFSLAIAHVGDTRILLSRVSDGAAVPLTSTHHPSSPPEAKRLRKWAISSFDSFGEERAFGNLANTRSFGDIASKRLGVSAEPEVNVIEAAKGEYAFLVLVSDGVTGVLGDQEIVDLVKECKTPEEAGRVLTGFAVDVAGAGEEGADNATAMVVRLGGWERRG